MISSCGTLSRTPSKNPKEPSEIDFPDADRIGQKIEEGVASWYGPKFHGKLTANGEQYDMHQYTAAHRTLPFDTIVNVKNLDNGKEVQVRINDRGPFAKNRIIDLSKKAASEIDMIGNGTANVALFVMEGSLENSRTTDLKVATYTVQLGSFQEKNKAFEQSRKITGSRVETVELSSQKVYRVFYGTFVKKEDAKEKMRELARQGYRGYVKQIQN
nr:septal ring lytic transglycosylase RlpA family protein [Fodinibius salicampi]